MPLPAKNYHSLQSLATRWAVGFEDIRYYVEHKELSVCCWIDRRKMMRYLPDDDNDKITCEYLKFEGYVGLHASDCRKIFRCGKYKVVNFVDLENPEYHLATTPTARDVLLQVDDMVVTTSERSRFEQEHDLDPEDYPLSPCKAEIIGKLNNQPDEYKTRSRGLYLNTKKYQYLYNGTPFTLGPIQANIVKQLAEVHSSKSPWVNSKKLLKESGSNAVRIRDVFKTHSLWGEIIDSDRRGNYRLKEGLIVNLD